MYVYDRDDEIELGKHRLNQLELVVDGSNQEREFRKAYERY